MGPAVSRLVVCCSAFLLTTPWCGAQKSDVERLVSKLIGPAGRLQNLYIEGMLDRERFGDDAWVDDGEVHFRVWLDGKPDGRMRFDVPKERMPWIGGSTPFSEDSWELAFDGRESRLLMHQIRQGMTWQKRAPKLKWATRFSGWDFTLYGAFGWHGGQDKGESFPDYLSKQARAFAKVDPKARVRGKLEVTEEKTREGKVTAVIVSVSFISKKTRTRTWRLDPAKDYAVTRFSSTSGDPPLERTRATVHEFVQPEPGIWYPKRLTIIQRDRKTREPSHRMTLKISHIVANDDAFDPDVFELRFPLGVRVIDQR